MPICSASNPISGVSNEIAYHTSSDQVETPHKSTSNPIYGDTVLVDTTHSEECWKPSESGTVVLFYRRSKVSFGKHTIAKALFLF